MKRTQRLSNHWPAAALALFLMTYAVAQTYVVQTSVTDPKGNIVATATTQFSAGTSSDNAPATTQVVSVPANAPAPAAAGNAHGLTLAENLPARSGVVYQTTLWMQSQQYDALGFVVPNIPGGAAVISTPSTPGHLASDFADFNSALTAARTNGSLAVLFRDGGVYTNNQVMHGCMNNNCYLRGGSNSHPVLIGRIGIGGWNDRHLPRPVLLQGFGIGGKNAADGTDGPLQYVMVLGLDFYGDARDPASPTFNSSLASNGWYQPSAITARENGTETPISNIWIEDCRFHYMMSGVSIMGASGTQTINTVIVRGCVFDHTYGDHFGLFDDYTHDFLVADCTFDHNGWDERAFPKDDPLGRNHNIYFGVPTIAQTSDPLHRVFNTILARAGAEGIEANSGGDLDTILFGVNPIAGYTGGGFVGNINNFVVDGGGGLYDQGTPGSALALAMGNAASNRGIGVFLDCATSGSITNGVVCNKPDLNSAQNSWAVGVATIDSPKGLPSEATTANIVNVTIDRWSRWGPVVNQPAVSAASDLQLSQAGPPTPVVTYSECIFPGVNGIAGVTGTSPQYVDPTRCLTTYAQFLGYTDGPSFLAAACRQSAANWDDRLTAAAAVNWIRAGFAVKK